MNAWLNRWLWLSAITLFAGLSLSKAFISIGFGLLSIGCIIHIVLAGWPKNHKDFLPLQALGLFYIFYITSLIYCSNFQEGLEEIYAQNAFITIPVIFFILQQWFRDRISLLLDIFLLGCLFHCSLTILFLLFPENIVETWVSQFDLLQPYPRLTDRLKFGLYTPFIERLNLAYLIGFGLLYLSYQIVSGNKSIWNFFQVGVLGIAFLLIGARGAQLAFLMAFAAGSLMIFLNRLKQKDLTREVYQQRVTSFITIILLVGLGGPFLAYKTIPAVKKRYAQMQWELNLIKDGTYKQEEYQYFTSLSRIRAWSNAWSIVKTNPFFGVGISDYRDELRIENSKYNDLVPVHNQNFYLYLWGSSGILALTALLIGILQYLKSFDWQYSILGNLVFTYILFICLSSLVDAFIIYHIGSFSVMIFLSSLYILNRKIGLTDD